MKPLLFLLLVGLVPTLPALDLGGTVDTSAGVSVSSAADSFPSVQSNTSLRLWLTTGLGPDLNLLAKVNLANALAVDVKPDYPLTNTFSGGLDTLVIETSWLKLGRTDVRDFGGQVLNSKLDAIQLGGSWAGWDLKSFLGTSARLYKSASTIIISEEDVADRQVAENWSKPWTMWAAPRVVGGLEANARQLVTDQNFQFSLLAQADLRAKAPNDREHAYTDVARREGAPVSTAYAGLGWSGRLSGALYGSAWAYGVAGNSLTPVGAPLSETTGSGKDKTELTYQTWRSSQILGALGSASLTLLVPSASFFLAEAGAQLGSWDPDGATPDQNAGRTPRSKSPSQYTGWTGISRTGGALIFNPQPANLGTARLIVSFKPFDSVQVASSTFWQARPTTAGITESGLLPKSKALYLGSESDLSLLWRPASDLVTAVSAGGFFPNPDAMSRTVEVKVQVSVALNF